MRHDSIEGPPSKELNHFYEERRDSPPTRISALRSPGILNECSKGIERLKGKGWML